MMGVQAQALLHHAAEDARLDSVRWAVNLPQEFTGEGVIIGITDWGFDYTHPVFYDTNITVCCVHGTSSRHLVLRLMAMTTVRNTLVLRRC